MKKVAVASGIFLFLFAGGLWVGLAQLIPAGVPRSIIIVTLGVVFAGIFVWLLIRRVQAILGGAPHRGRHAAVAALELGLVLTAFAAVYQKLGIMDNTQPDSPVTHSFLASLYYSVVTFTTLGYGDFYPMGLGRALAGIEALIGYMVLGILASTAASLLSQERSKEEGEDGDDRQEGSARADGDRRSAVSHHAGEPHG